MYVSNKKIYKVVSCFLTVLLCGLVFVLPVFAASPQPITDTQKFFFYGTNGQVYFPERENVYSITHYTSEPSYPSNGYYSYLISGTSFSNFDETTKSLVISFLTADLNFVYGQTYQFSLGCFQHPSYLNDELANLSFVFTNSNNEVVDVQANSYLSNYGTLTCSFVVSENISKIDIVIVGHIPKSNNRFHCILSPLSIGLVNSADLGGTFDETVPNIPDVDIDTYLDDFANINGDALNTLNNGFFQVSGSVQSFSLFFSKVWSDLTTASPEIMYVVYFALAFGVIALILNIYSFAKGQGTNTGNSTSTGRHKGGSPK